jgi:hypothetical protein
VLLLADAKGKKKQSIHNSEPCEVASNLCAIRNNIHSMVRKGSINCQRAPRLGCIQNSKEFGASRTWQYVFFDMREYSKGRTHRGDNRTVCTPRCLFSPVSLPHFLYNRKTLFKRDLVGPNFVQPTQKRDNWSPKSGVSPPKLRDTGVFDRSRALRSVKIYS